MENIILVIDDDRNLVDLVSFALAGQGFEVTAAYDGLSGYELAKNLRPNLILLDVNMPGLDGWETLRRLKNTPQTKEVPVVMVTSVNLVKDIDKAIRMGANDYLVKPINMEQLAGKVSGFFKNK